MKHLGSIFIFMFIIPLSLLAQVLDFEVIKKEGDSSQSPTLLLIGGIQGDEPGGFNATNIFLMHYKIQSGSVWVIPVLNKHSMLLNHRGIYGDMNRKFDHISDDPEQPIIEKVKSLITDPQVDAILHLHDGSGFYRPTFIDQNRNPSRWGGCCIIDQETLQGARFPNLGEIIDSTIAHINENLISPDHQYYKRDTQTAKGDVEMEKALTYFAVRHQKSAFAHEASKSLALAARVYYHLLAIESLFQQLGIEYQRDFKLTPHAIYQLINSPALQVSIAHSITLPLYGLRSELKFFPLPKTEISKIELHSQAHIIGLLERNNQVWIKYGNKLMTRLNPQFMDFDSSLKSITILQDGEQKEVQMGSIISVKDHFEIAKLPEGYRVNIIGFVKPNDNSKEPDESQTPISLKDCAHHFSIDKKGRIYRAEFYKGKVFAGMILFKFL